MKKMLNANLTFQQAMEQLDGAVKALESGALSLNDAMKTYEEAVALLRFCHGALENAERRVSVLLEDKSGELVEAPFTSADAT